MIDNYGRNIDYIRISLTDRCNLRCIYCMPEEGVESMSHVDILSFEEIQRIVGALAHLGFKKVKLTGGEPLVRRGCASLLRNIKEIPGIEKVTLTTNGVLLKEQMADLAEAGLDAINISLDTLDPKEFQRVTRRDDFDRVMAGIEEALQYEKIPVKLNCVPMERDPENLIRMAGLAKEKRLHVRFIEMMPIGMGKQFEFLSEDEILKILTEAYGPAEPVNTPLGYGPGHYYSFEGFEGKIGFISAVSHKFCASCNRVRLTADGWLKACLQYQIGSDIKSLIRQGCTDEELEEAIRDVLLHKPAGHSFTEEAGDGSAAGDAVGNTVKEVRGMSQIGG